MNCPVCKKPFDPDGDRIEWVYPLCSLFYSKKSQQWVSEPDDKSFTPIAVHVGWCSITYRNPDFNTTMFSEVQDRAYEQAKADFAQENLDEVQQATLDQMRENGRFCLDCLDPMGDECPHCGQEVSLYCESCAGETEDEDPHDTNNIPLDQNGLPFFATR